MPPLADTYASHHGITVSHAPGRAIYPAIKENPSPHGRHLFPQVVDARELHGKLGVQTDFRHWITRRIEECGMIEGEDFLAVKNDRVGIIQQKDYLLSLDAAKHLAMMERNEAGKHIRAYFIEVEKDWRTKALALPQDYASALRALAEKVEKNARDGNGSLKGL